MPFVTLHRSLIPHCRPRVMDRDQKPPSPWVAPIQVGYKYMRGIDGVDDSTVVAGQILPALGAAALQMGVMVGAVPFGVAGTVGSYDDAKERFKTGYPESKRRVEQQGDYARALMAREHQQSGQFDTPGIRHAWRRYDTFEAERRIELVERNISPAAAAGMGCMTGGMLASAGAGGAGVAEAAAAGAGTAASAAMAGAVLSTISTAVFLPGQIAMAGYGVGKVVAGVKRERQFREVKTDLNSLTGHVAADVLQSTQQGNSRMRRYNAQHSIGCGAGMAAGQVLMAAGSIGSLSGIGAPVALALSASGAPLTLGSAIGKIVIEKKQARFVGEGASDRARETVIARDVSELISRKGGGIDKAITLASRHYLSDQDALAQSKLLSLITCVIDKEPADKLVGGVPRDPLSVAVERRAKVEKMTETGKKGLFVGTTLLKNDLLKMRQQFDAAYPVRFFEGSKDDVRIRVNERLTSHPIIRETLAREPMQQRLLRKTVRELTHSREPEIKQFVHIERGEKTRRIDNESLDQLRKGNASADAAYNANFSREVVRRMKTDAKHLRQDMGRTLAELGHVKRLEASSPLDPSKAWRLPEVAPYPPYGSHSFNAARRDDGFTKKTSLSTWV